MANKNFYKKYLIIIAVVLIAIFFNNYLLGNFLQNIFYKTISKTGIFTNDKLFILSRFREIFWDKQRIVEEGKRLEEENNLLSGRLAELESLKRENQFLRDQLGVADRSEMKLMIAQIFNIQRGSLTSSALINRGAKDGVEKSMSLIAAGNIFVGVVDQVFENSAVVLLIDDPRVKVSGRIQESRVLTNIKGRLQNQIELDLVAAGDEIKNGDTVVTSGLDGLPESLLVAKVAKVEMPSGAIFKTVTAQPLFDPSLGSSLFLIIR